MRYFFIAIFLHGLLFLKLALPTTTSTLNNIPIKHNIQVQFQQVATASPLPAPSSKEKIVEKKLEPIKDKKEIIKKVEKKSIKKIDEKRKSSSSKKLEEKKVENYFSYKQETPSAVSKGVPDGILQSNGDGTYNALSEHGIKYKIIREVQPEYPKQAENIRYRKRVIIKAKFLVGENGNVKNISIVTSHNKLGFDQAVITALNRWKFSPIVYEGKIIKVYFQKEFIFEPRR